MARDEAYLSPMYYELIGYREGEIQPNRAFFESSVHPDDLPTVANTMAAHFQGKCRDSRFEYRMRMKSGEYKWMSAVGQVVERDQTGAPMRMVGTIVDITERKRAEETLGESEALHRSLIETTGTGYAILDTAGKVLDANAEYVRLSGHEGLNEIRGRSVTEWTAAHEKNKNIEAVAKCARGGYVRNLEVDYSNQRGQITPIEINATVVTIGGTPRIVALCRDISERRRTELLLLQAQDALERTVEQRTRELHESNRKLQAETEARLKSLAELDHMRQAQAQLSRAAVLKELTCSIAHELNQPLTAIFYNASAAQRFFDSESVDTRDLRAIINDIVADVRHAAEIIRKMRQLFKTGHVDCAAVDANSLVLEAAQLTGNAMAHHGAILETSLAPDLPIIQADGVQLIHVLTNLVLNACDAVTHVAAPDRRVAIRTALAENGYIQISVTDEGRGIEPAMQDKIFDPFHSTKQDGLGLGLSICRTIVSAHGGRIWAVNNAERGASFHFILPVNRSTGY
jgi:PAS domain S-box-containing protein